MFATICFLVCIATACLLLWGRDVQALLAWGAARDPGASAPGGFCCPQPIEPDPSSQDIEAHKAFCRKTNDQNVDFGEQPK